MLNDFCLFKHFVKKVLTMPKPYMTLLISKKLFHLSKPKSPSLFGKYQPLLSWSCSERTKWPGENYPTFRTCCSSLLNPKSVSAASTLRFLPSYRNNNRAYHHDQNNNNSNDQSPLKLMDFPEIIWPSPLKSFRNWWFSKLIKGYYDNSFTMESFITGAEQAIHHVSSCLAEGDFEELRDVVEPSALQEIQNNYADLSMSQRNFLAIKPEDLFLRFIYEIGMMFDDSANQRFVEITVVSHGFHGFHDAKKKDPREYYNYVRENTKLLYVCNYRFIREFTKGATSDDWIINKLNHFVPNELTLT